MGLLTAALSAVFAGCQMITLEPPYQADSYAFSRSAAVTAETLPGASPIFNLGGPTIPERLPDQMSEGTDAAVIPQTGETSPAVIPTQPQPTLVSSTAEWTQESTAQAASWAAVESTAAAVSDMNTSASPVSANANEPAAKNSETTVPAVDFQSCSHDFQARSIPAVCAAGGYEIELCLYCGRVNYIRTEPTGEHHWQTYNGVVSCAVCGRTVDETKAEEEEFAEGDGFTGNEDYAEGDALAKSAAMTVFAHGTPAPWNGISYTESGADVHLHKSSLLNTDLEEDSCLFVNCEIIDWDGNASADLEAFVLPAVSESAQLSALYHLYDGTASGGGLYMFWKREGSLHGYRLFYADYGSEILQPDGGPLEDVEQIRSILKWFGLEETEVPENQKLQ